MKYYNDLDRTPLGIFVNCYVDNDIESLIIEGNVPHETLLNAWELILDDFSARMANQKQKTYLKLLQETNGMAASMNIASTLINTMTDCYHPLFGKMLNTALTCNMQWPDTDREMIDRQLKRCKSLMNPIEMRHTMKKAQLEIIISELDKKATGQKPTRAYFDLLVNLVEEHFTVPCDYNILTGRFCDKVNRMNEQIRKQKAKRK